MAKKICLIDVATTTATKEYTKKVKVSQLLADLHVDLSKSTNIALRVGCDVVTMDTLVDPGATVLLTRNISGG